MTSWRTSLRSCRYCVQDRHPFLLYSGVEMLGPDVAFEGPATVPAGNEMLGPDVVFEGPATVPAGNEMLGPDVAFEGPAPVPAGKTVALLFSTLKCSRHFIIVSFPRISTFSRSFRIGPDHHWRW